MSTHFTLFQCAFVSYQLHNCISLLKPIFYDFYCTNNYLYLSILTIVCILFLLLYLLNFVCTLDFAFAAKFLLMWHVIYISLFTMLIIYIV